MTIFWLHSYLFAMLLPALFFLLCAAAMAIRKMKPNLLPTIHTITKNLSINIIQQVPKMAKMLFLCAVFFVIGHQYRDITAYREFTERRPANWTIIAAYPSRNYAGTSYDLLLSDGSIVPNFTPCSDVGLQIGMRVSKAGYYQRENCSDFRGPRAYIVKEH